MGGAGFDYTPLLRRGLAAPAPRFGGFPKFNFIGGHNDPSLIPVEALADAAAAVLRREGPSLAMYNLAHGPQGFVGLRDFVVTKLAGRGIASTRDDILITSGSGPGIELGSPILIE